MDSLANIDIVSDTGSITLASSHSVSLDKMTRIWTLIPSLFKMALWGGAMNMFVTSRSNVTSEVHVDPFPRIHLYSLRFLRVILCLKRRIELG